jgi:protein Mpv17
MLFQGPALHYFYTFLDSRVCPTNPTCPRAVITKTAADQLGMAPVGTVAFFAFMEICKGHPAGVAAAVSAGFFPTLKASYMIWPAAHLINFRFCPPDKRVLFVNFVSLAWSTILSLLSICVVAQ